MRRLTAALAGLAALAATPGAAQDTGLISIQTYSEVTLFAPPPWSSAEHAATASEVVRNQGPTGNGTDYFILEFVPKGQSFEAWIELYALTAETPLEGSARDYRDGMAASYQAACRDSALQPILDEPARQIFLLFCTAYAGDPKVGEIAVMHYRKAGDVLIRNYYHKRGEAYALDAPDALPLSRDETAELIRHVAAMRQTRGE
ncbi:MAG: hypothetical protein QNJ16_19440 [Rhodobacter sp.]|nr:hypothetical protein [Rhodobacter sp.]